MKQSANTPESPSKNWASEIREIGDLAMEETANAVKAELSKPLAGWSPLLEATEE